MDKMDNEVMTADPPDDYELFLQHVVQEDHELLYLHSYLEELLGAAAK